MATQNLTAGQRGRSSAGMPAEFMIEKYVDATVTPIGAGDVLQLLDVQAGWLVKEVLVDVETIEDSAATADIGDGDDPDGYDAAVDLAVAAKSRGNGVYINPVVTTATPLPGVGKLYAAADTIDATVSAACGTVKFRVRAWIVDLGSDIP